MTRIALVTAIAAYRLDEDIPPLVEALAAHDIACEELAWDDATVSWGRFDAALLRSAWDYAERREAFLAWCRRTAAQTRLLNPEPVLHWNTDKHYLAQLADAGIATVESAFIEPGQAPSLLPEWDEFVVKPAIGAGSRDTQRYRANERPHALDHVARLLDAGRSVLAQPYLAAVDSKGETALMYFDGRFSHAIRKGPLLRPGEGPTESLFAAEQIDARKPSRSERALADAVIEVLPGVLKLDRPPLYARVDLLPSRKGPRLLEVELTEPSLFFAHGKDAAARMAACVVKRLSG
jgi:glutathione synthase/RimK-type ligase-like ATP-grasp enzyme